MNISGLSVKHPVTVIVIFALVMGIAITMIPNLAVDLYPSTANPTLSISTRFPGAGPSEVERNVTQRLERSLAGLRGLTNMTSSSSFESSSINLRFAYGTNMDKAMSDAQTIINRLANSLPDGAQTPMVRRFDMSASPIMRLIVRGNYPPDQLRLFAEDEIQAKIERIEGVAAADVTGGTTQVIKVAVALNRLAAFNLTLSDVNSALRGQNILSSGGNLIRGTREYQIMTQEELNSVEQIRRLVVRTVNIGAAGPGQPNRSQVVRLQDIADVNLSYNDNAARVYINGESGVFIQVTSESDSNQVQVADRVSAALDGINAELPRGIALEVLSDNTSMIKATMSQVYTNALQGALLAMAVLLLFLRNIKGTIIIGLAVPISMLLTIMCMSIFGFSLNLLTMAGLIMGLGMTMDASIVIIENIHTYRLRGAKPEIAAILGSREMLRAVMASSITTLCVFIPMIMYKNDLEMMGQLFNDLIFTVVISLVVSLIVAITLVPSLSGAVLKLNTRIQKPLKNRLLRAIDNAIEYVLVTLENAYKKALGYCLTHRVLVASLAFALLFYSVLQFGNIGMNMYFRSRTDDSVNLNLSMPQGTTMEVTERVLFDIEELIKSEIEGYRNIILTARRGGSGTIQITLPPPAMQIDGPDAIIRKLTPYTNSMPGALVSFRAGRSAGSSNPVEIVLTSRDYNAIMATADDIISILNRYLPEIEEPAVNISEGAPQLMIQIDRERAAALGISLSAIASEIRTAMDGTTAASISMGDRLVNVNVMLRDEDRAGMPNLDAVFVMSRSGSRISLSNVASIVEGRAPSSIRRERQQRVVRITGGLAEGIAATEIDARVADTVREYLIPRENVTVTFMGESAEIQAYYGRYILIIGTAVFLVFGVMASQFESFVDPLIIFFTIPMLIIGVVWIYKFSNQAMSMFSIVGIVALVGVVVNSGIILVDCTNTLRARGMKVKEACMEAGRSRLRPILMTSLTTILGMSPIAFFAGAGAESIEPIAKTFVGGLFVSTFMTLFVIPSVYSLLNSRHDKKEAKKPMPGDFDRGKDVLNKPSIAAQVF